MEEKTTKPLVCYNLKLPHSECAHCIWLEWNEDGFACLNRKQMVCPVHVEEIFGDLIPKTLN